MENQLSTARIALKWGLIFGLAQIAFSIIIFLTDNFGNTALGSVTYILIAISLVMAMRDFRNLNGGYMAYGQGISVGTLTAAISGLLSSLFSVFYMTVIDTGIMERVMDKTREQMEAQGNLSDEQIDQAIEITQKFQSPGILFAVGVIGSAIIGLIFSLVIAAIMKKDKTNPF